MVEVGAVSALVSAEAVLESMGVAVLVLDPVGRIEFVNQLGVALLGWTPQQLVGAEIERVLHRHSSTQVIGDGCSLLVSARTASGRADVDDVFLKADGSAVPVTWTAQPILVPAGGNADGRSGIGAATGGTVVTFAVTDAPTPSTTATPTEPATREQQRADLWEMQQSVNDLGWIAELTRVMTSTMDEAEALRAFARLLTPRLAEVVLVDLIDDDGQWYRLGGSVADGLTVDLPAILAAEAAQHSLEDRETRAVAAANAVTLFDSAQMSDPAVLSAPSREVLAAIGAGTMLVVPLAARSRTVGVAGLIRLERHAYSIEDMELAADIGRRAGLVLDNARLYRRQLRTAETLQRALLPTVHDTEHLRVVTSYRPAADQLRVGGDWYDVIERPLTPAAHVLVVGDVAGHDLPAAATMSALRNVLRGIVVTGSTAVTGSSGGPSGGPAQVLTVLDAAMTSLAVPGTATAVVVYADRGEGEWTLTWSNAGHPPVVVIEPASRDAEFLDAQPEPLLGAVEDAGRTDHTRVVPFGTRLVLYTDGLIERRDEDLDQGLRRLQRAASAHADTAAELLSTVLTSIPDSPDDDTAVLIVELN